MSSLRLGLQGILNPAVRVVRPGPVVGWLEPERPVSEGLREERLQLAAVSVPNIAPHLKVSLLRWGCLTQQLGRDSVDEVTGVRLVYYGHERPVLVHLEEGESGATTLVHVARVVAVPDGDQLSRSAVSVLATESMVAYDGTAGTQTTTTVDTVQQNNYNYLDVPQSDVSGAAVFYAMLSTVVQDPTTQAVFESQQSGPLTCGFVNLKLVSPTDFLALQRREDIAGRMISQVNRNYPNLDLSPRSELRDLMIDPVAVELSNMSVREWFARASESISAISQIDDANGDGYSDPFNSSPGVHVTRLKPMPRS